MSDVSPTVLVISSHVVRGSVGNRAAAFALEALGHPVWAMPTVVLPWHPGHGPATRLSFAPDDFERALDDLAKSPRAGEIKAVLTGYFANEQQVHASARLIQALRDRRPDLFYVCDPVMGDFGGLYIPEATAAAVRDQLIPLASLATPNRFELGWMAGASLETNAAVIDAALSLGPAQVLATSAVAMMKGSTGNLFLSGRHALMAEHRAIEGSPNGLGDLLAALMLSRLVKGEDEERALQMATSTVFEVAARAVKRGSDELMLETDIASLSTPMAMVQMRRLHHPAKSR